MKLVDCNDPILSKKTVPFDFSNEDDCRLAKSIEETLREVLIRENALGVAAPQINVIRSVFAIGNPKDAKSIKCYFNPFLVDTSEETVYYEEGCLSFKGLFIKIKRPAHIRVRYTDSDGETHTEKMTGLTARVFQHELDHLNGVTFVKIANPYHLEKAKKDYRNLMRKRRKENV